MNHSFLPYWSFLFYLLFSVSVEGQDSISYYLNPDQTYSSFEKQVAAHQRGLDLAIEKGEQEQQIEAYFLLAIDFRDHSQFAKALEYLKSGRQLAEKENYQLLAAKSYYLEGILLFRLARYEEAEQLHLKSIDLFAQFPDTTFGKEKNQFQIGNIHGIQGRLDQAESIYKQLIPIFEKANQKELLMTTSANLAVSYLKKNQPERAIPYFKQNLQDHITNNKKIQEARACGNLAFSYSLLKKYNKAFDYYNRSIRIAEEEGFKDILFITLYDLSETYEMMGNHKMALQTFKRYHTLRDSVIGQRSQAKISELQVRYDTELKERKLRESQEEFKLLQQAQKMDRQRSWLLVVGLFSLLFIGILLFLKQRSDFQRKKVIQKAQKQLMESELQHRELEGLRLQEQLDYKNKDLTNLAIDITRKNEFSKDLIQRLQDLEKTPPEELKAKLRALKHYTVGQFQIGEDLKMLQMNVEKINQNFYHQLDKLFDNLSPKDKTLCGLIRLNISNKEIATINNISVKSAKMSRYRLRKKLALDSEVDIVKFLQEI